MGTGQEQGWALGRAPLLPGLIQEQGCGCLVGGMGSGAGFPAISGGHWVSCCPCQWGWALGQLHAARKALHQTAPSLCSLSPTVLRPSLPVPVPLPLIPVAQAGSGWLPWGWGWGWPCSPGAVPPGSAGLLIHSQGPAASGPSPTRPQSPSQGP